MPIRVLGRPSFPGDICGGTGFDIAEEIRFAAGIVNSSGTVPSVKANVINMSLGGSGFNQTEQDAITDARNAGVIVIATAGQLNVTNITDDAPWLSVDATSFPILVDSRNPHPVTVTVDRVRLSLWNLSWKHIYNIKWWR